MRINACSKTDPGLKRPRNEDVCATDIVRRSFMVADGMGGVAGGDVASTLFLETVNQSFPTEEAVAVQKAMELVRNTFLLANSRILAHAAATPLHRGLGCTAELLTLCQDSIVLGHVGDSRTYCFRDGHLDQLTRDHSMVQEQVDLGIITQHQANTSRLRNVLTRAVGMSAKLTIDISSRQAHPGDIYLLATDGLHGMVDDQEILLVLAFSAPLALKAEMLINMANDAGGRDNISVTLLEILE
ncbi:MAG: protein phosphatase 2C domain-containing protein [Proteobacteria bacterium]|nr:protein phosphatase 2C domain-containing protein [Pseudomonadota bacterium]